MKIRSLRVARNSRALAVIAIAAGALVAFVLPSSADVSAESPPAPAIKVESPAKLQARGAGLILSVTFVCQPGFTGFVNAEVSQRVSNRIARGFGNDQRPCTGEPQTMELPMTAQDAPFHRGVAFAKASLFVGSGPTTDAREIQIVR